MTQNGTTNLGFTVYGRPVETFDYGMIPLILSAAMRQGATVKVASNGDKPHKVDNVNDRYQLVGADMTEIAGDLKSFAFAKSAALRWSRQLGEPVGIYKAVEFKELGAGVTYERLVAEEVVSAHTMSAEEFAAETLLVERARLENVLASLDEIAMDIRATREDAQEALNNLAALDDIEGAPTASLAEAARRYAEAFERRAWYVLIDEADADMIGELTA